jgi:outer membrane protein assembly factor BamB
LKSFIRETLELPKIINLKEKEKELANSKSKTTIAVALLIILAMTISLFAFPGDPKSAVAATTSYPYIGALPNPAGVGQDVLLHVGVLTQLQDASQGWKGLSVTIKKPDGTTETIPDITTDATGGTGRTFTPTMEGNYTLQTHFPAQWFNYTDYWGNPVDTLYAAADSEELTLVVLAEPVPVYPGHALPTEYWTRPIDPQLREWAVVAGNWLETPDNKIALGNDDAPETAHVLWAKVLTQGGLVGEPLDSHSFEIGDAYEGKFISRLILAGKLYYDLYATADPYHKMACVDIHTGEELWSRTLLDNETIDFGQTMFWDTYDYHGVYDYLWASLSSSSRSMLVSTDRGRNNAPLNSSAGDTWAAFDPMNGDFVWALYNIPDGTRVTGPKGEILFYNVNTAGGYVEVWNSSAVISLRASTDEASMGFGQWRAMGKVQNATGACGETSSTPFGINGLQENITIPNDLGSGASKIFQGDRIIGSSVTLDYVYLWGVNLDPDNGQVGRELFRNNWTAPAYWREGNLTISGFSGGLVTWSNDPYVAVMWIKETREHYGFSLETGEELWGPTPSQYYLDAVEDSPGDVRAIAYGNFYSASVSGIVYCYDATNGTLLWSYAATDPYSEYLFANQWWMKLIAIADGKLYCGTTEHSPIDPRPRGGPFICLNATTGEVIWRVNGMFRQTRWGGRGLMGDSMFVTMDTYDQRIYAVGKGPSATTVTASPAVSMDGDTVLVKGMVTDISPGTNSPNLQMRFPNGVPAVADENQSDWMLHVYKQFEQPANVVGVDVVISVIDPNNNCYEVGTTTSDASGYFGTTFMPLVPGFYTVIASFEGSGAYYGSYAETFINVEQAPTATAAPTPTPAPMTDTYVLGIGAGAIVAIVVIGLVIILMLRKR